MNLNLQLRKYYFEIFPIKKIFEIYKITNSREISFCTQQGNYIRYLSFDNPIAFYDKLLEIIPVKIDIGPIFTDRPSKLGISKPILRELVFDIDITDYPRTCCQGKTICNKCYLKIKCAIKLLNYILRKEFGFKQIGFVFSGRRGLHCWVFDHINFSAIQRSDIYKYFQNVIDKDLCISEYDLIIKEFIDEEYIDHKIMLNEWFIKIDKSVTIGINHLCKIPFSVHAESLKLSVPIDPENILELDEYPTLLDIINEPTKINYFIEILNEWTKF